MVVAVAVYHPERIRIWHLRLRHQIAPAQFHAVKPAFSSGNIDESFHHINHFRPTRAAIRAGRRGVAHDRSRAKVRSRHSIDGRHDLDPLAQRRKIGCVSTRVTDVRAPHGEEVTFLVKCELCLDDEVAPLIVGCKRLLSFASPLDGSPDAARGPNDQCEFPIKHASGTEMATHVARNDPHCIFGSAKHDRNIHLRAPGAAGAGVQSVKTGRFIVITHCGTRLHWDTCNPRNPCLEGHYMCSTRESSHGGLSIARFRIETHV